MGALVKRLVTEYTFWDSMTSEDDVRFLKLRIDSEGAGRFLVLSDESSGCSNKSDAIYFHSPDDLKLLYDSAQELWDQGGLYHDKDL